MLTSSRDLRSDLIKAAGLFESLGRDFKTVAEHPVTQKLKGGLEWMGTHPRTMLGLGSAATAGAGYLGNRWDQQAQLQQQRQLLARQTAAQVPASTSPTVHPEPPPDTVQRGAQGFKDFAATNWPWLVGGGLAAGGAALLWKRMADKRRQEEEDALLGRMYDKEAMARLAREYPVQVGFLVRCGERGLSGPEVATAVEKCASVSNHLAEEWTDFFKAAAGGMDETARAVISRPAPRPPLSPAPSIPSTPRPAPAPRPAPTPPSTGINPWTAMLSGGGLSRAAAPPPKQFEPPSELLHPGTAGRGGGNPALPPVAQAPGPPSAKPLDATTAMRLATGWHPSQAQELAHYRQYARQMGYTTDVSPSAYVTELERPLQVGQLGPDRRRLLGYKPFVGTRWNEAWQPVWDEPVPEDITAQTQFAHQGFRDIRPGQGDLPPEALAAYNRMRQGGRMFERAESERPDTSFMGGVKRQMRATPDQIRAGQQQVNDALDSGMDYQHAQLQDPTRHVGWREGYGGALRELPGSIAGFGSMLPSALVDTGRGLAGQGWDFRHVRGAATEAADPLFRGGGIDPLREWAPGYGNRAHQQGLFTGSGGFAGSGRPGDTGMTEDYAQRMQDYHDTMPAGPLRGLVGTGTWAMRNAEPIAETLTLAGMGSGGGGAGAAGGGAEGGAAEAGTTAARPFLRRAADFIARPVSNMMPQSVKNFGQRVIPSWATRAMPGSLSARGSEAAGQLASTYGWISGGKPEAAAFQAAVEQSNEASGVTDKEMLEQRRMEAAMGDRPADIANLPTNIRDDPERIYQLMVDNGESAVRAAQVKAQQEGRTLTTEEADKIRNDVAVPYMAHYKELRQQQISQQIPGMSGPNGQYNPAGQIDTTGMDPKNVRTWLTPERRQALAYQNQQDVQRFNEMVRNLDPQIQQVLSNGQPIDDAMKQQIKAAGLDPDQAISLGKRMATGTSVLAAETMAGGDMTRLPQHIETPEAGHAAAERNPDLADAARQRVITGQSPDMGSAISDVWNSMDTMGKILTFGGAGLGIVSLLSGLLGEGGLGSLLTAVLGGGMALFGANRAGLLGNTGVGRGTDAALQALGLGQFGSPGIAAMNAGGGAPAEGQTPSVQGMAAAGGAAATGGAAPAAPQTELGRLAALPPAEQMQQLFPGVGNQVPTDPARLLALKQKLDQLSGQYSVPELRQLTAGIDPARINQLRQAIQEHRGDGSWMSNLNPGNFSPEVADELLAALQPQGAP
jgi:hypothetical protein